MSDQDQSGPIWPEFKPISVDIQKKLYEDLKYFASLYEGPKNVEKSQAAVYFMIKAITRFLYHGFHPTENFIGPMFQLTLELAGLHEGRESVITHPLRRVGLADSLLA